MARIIWSWSLSRGLEAAHKKHITHRDLKPANILVTASGMKLLDLWSGGGGHNCCPIRCDKLMGAHVGISFTAPSEIVFKGYLDQLKLLSQDMLREEFGELISGKASLDLILKAKDDRQPDLWDEGAFTNPANHNPAKFRYIIHAMCPAIRFMGTRQRDYMKSKGREKFMTDTELKVAEHYLTESSVLKREVLCCSLIDQDKTSTFRGSTFGFVLDVPKRNLCAAFASDASTASKISRARADRLSEMPDPIMQLLESEFLDDLSGLYSGDLRTPDEILAEAKKHEGHNELVVMGSLPGSSIRVSAIFIKVSKDNKILQSFVDADTLWGLSTAIRACAQRLAIPIVAVP